jgi:hypothetical protein
MTGAQQSLGLPKDGESEMTKSNIQESGAGLVLFSYGALMAASVFISWKIALLLFVLAMLFL